MITVITVVKNDVRNIEETIVNVIENKEKADINYVIIDGGSTDGTIEIIRKYSDYLSYWLSEPDNGIYDAMNKGWQVATDNSYILFLGAGDKIVSLPSSLNNLDVVYGHVHLGDKRKFAARTGFHLKLYNSLHHQALLIRKSLHPEPPFNCCYKVYADFDFNQRLMKSGARFVQATDFIGYARPGGVSDHSGLSESLKIIYFNYGIIWVTLALISYAMTRVFPFLKRLSSLQER